MTDQLRMAVIGAGRTGQVHAENLANRVKGAQLIAATTSNTSRATEVRRRCGDIATYAK